jgi:putative oxidoreductase
VDNARNLLYRLLRRFSLPLLRASMGVVFVWFGALKVAGVTPADELVAATVPWLDPDWFVPALGWFEMALGVALVVGARLGWVCAVMVGHLGGTFLTVVMQPGTLFQDGNPLMLTMEGEFVAKNLVLITAALAIVAWSRERRERFTAAPSRQRAGAPGVELNA